MSKQFNNSDPDDHAREAQSVSRSSRITVEEIAERLDIGRQAVYAMLDRGILPGVRVGRRWIITRHSYEQWERTCGTRAGAGLGARPEVMVLN
jgi:excisionase family DNA binding protein